MPDAAPTTEPPAALDEGAREEPPVARQAGRLTGGQLDARRLSVLELRQSGATFRDIAAALGVALSTAHRDYDMAIKKWATPLADKMRLLEGSRLDRLQLAVWQAALAQDHAAMRQVRWIMERRAKMFGLDEPTKVDIMPMIERIAEESGVPVEEVIAAAEDIIRTAQGA